VRVQTQQLIPLEVRSAQLLQQLICRAVPPGGRAGQVPHG